MQPFVMINDVAALALARNNITLRDLQMLAATTDAKEADEALILSMRATTSLSNVTRRLQAQSLEVQTLSNQLATFRHQANTLRRKNKEMKTKVRTLKQQGVEVET
ncbi:hypothetical protein LOK49_LG01G01302 [Camellia lanceoleosa]|uniref:Uncharacterized protein n=1 Tax=Camellia lanceoleosa TaxID=1840588 RepID=A0ACC0IVT2_9ERIC|nr:hypothetical protein LOK49_LG01G01302 [Camellia lanceoleosa]